MLKQGYLWDLRNLAGRTISQVRVNYVEAQELCLKKTMEEGISCISGRQKVQTQMI